MNGDGELLKAFVMTRGRTGSTAIVQELGAVDGARSEQEIFSAEPGPHGFPALKVWLEGQREHEDADDLAKLTERYLREMESDALARGCAALFWKALSHHVTERPYLAELLLRQGYKALYLTRGQVRQVLSGMVATQRNRFNTREKFQDDRSYRIDVAELRRQVALERQCVRMDLGLLYRQGFEVLEIRYEDYLADRAAFFGRIFDVLGLPYALPVASDFVVMIEDLRATIENYDEVRVAAVELGEPLEPGDAPPHMESNVVIV